MAKASAKVLSKECGLVQENVEYTETLVLTGGRKVRISIRSNPYSFQSHARAELWNGSEWKNVHKILSAKMKTPHGLYVRADRETPIEHHFKADRDELLRMADLVSAM